MAGRCYQFGAFRLDPASRVLYRGAEVVPLTPKCVETLVLLVENAGQVVDKNELMRRVWPDSFVDEINLTKNISILRKTIGEEKQGREFIETISKRGYRFVGLLRAVEDSAPAAARPASPREEPAARGRARALLWKGALSASLLLAILFVWVSSRRVRQAEAPSVRLVVLPFQNFTGDPGQEYVSDGFTEELISQLGRLSPKHLGVIARTSAMMYKSAHKAVPDIARELDVQYLLEGSLRRSGDQVRVTVQLIRARDQTHIWATEYDRPLTDIIAVQAEVSLAVAREIQIHVAPAENARLAGVQAARADVYEDYLRARYLMNQRRGDALDQAAGLLQQVVSKDPQFAQAYAGLADIYNVSAFYDRAPSGVAVPKALEAARRAVALDDSLAEGHAALAFSEFMWQHDWRAAQEEFRRALDRNPSYAPAHHWYALALAGMGRHDEAAEQIRLAQQLDPLSLIVESAYGYVEYLGRRYPSAIRHCRAALDVNPQFDVARAVLGWTYEEQGQHAAAINELQAALAHIGGSSFYLATLGHIYARSGNRAQAQRVLREISLEENRSNAVLSNQAILLADLGRTGEALEHLEQAAAHFDQRLFALPADPQFDGLRKELRFRALLRRLYSSD